MNAKTNGIERFSTGYSLRELHLPGSLRIAASLVCVMAVLACSGCTSVLSPIRGIPAHRLPPQFLAVPRANMVPIDMNMLRQPPPPQYRLAAGDVLGIYVEGVLGDPEAPPPVHFPEDESRLPPAIGFPMPIRDDGTLSLPLVDPILVQGMTLRQAEEAIRNEYTVNRKILQPGNDRIIVTLIKERTHRVIVVREDSAGGQTLNISGGQAQLGPVRRGSGEIVNLPAYQNDVLHALAETGGLPGLDAKNEVKIVKAKYANTEANAAYLEHCHQCNAGDPCYCPPPPPDAPGVIRIPLRVPPGIVPALRPEDIILEDGDIVYVEAREAEVFYTAGLLPGGQHTLPRDYDVTALAAMGIAGGGLDQGGRTGGGGMGSIGGLGGASPTDLFILRQLPCNQQITIRVDLTRAANNPRENILIAPGDTLLLRYAPEEEVVNFSLFTFFTYGVRELFRN